MIEKIRPIVKSMQGKRRYLCKCECGRELIVVEEDLLLGRIKTCGNCIKEPAIIPTAVNEEVDKVEKTFKKTKKGKR